MIQKYSQHINEAFSSETELYWDNSTFKKAIQNDWTQISVKRYNSEVNSIIFKSGDSLYSVLIEEKKNEDVYYLEDSDNVKIIKDFEKKFVEEFFKNGQEYYKNLQYIPKCLGDISYLADSDKYNM